MAKKTDEVELKDKENDLTDSEELEALAAKVIDQYRGSALRPNLLGHTPKIKYFLKRRMKRALGTCERARKAWKLLSGYDYIITVQRAFWDRAPHEDREALLLHELKHIQYIEPTLDDEGEIKRPARWSLARHDVEEFCDVVRNYGPWTPNIKSMVEVTASLPKKKLNKTDPFNEEE